MEATVDYTDNRKLIDQAYSLAYGYEQTHGNCPQCVMAAIQETLGGIDDETFKAGHALAGGGALTTIGTCGALAGALMAVSSYFGRDRANFGKGRFLQNYQLGKKVVERFVAEYGSPICGGVQAKIMGRSFDMWDAEDFKAFEAAGGHRDKCTGVAANAAAWAAETILEAKGGPR
jgi:C_GCAxxG_C_C family probable redox protein